MTRCDLRWLICAVLAACVAAPDDLPEVPDVIEVPIKKGCEDIVCGNAAMLGAHRWWELDASGTAFSPAGKVKIVDFRTAANVALKPVVEGYRLRGVAAGNVYYGGAALVGAHLWIDSDIGEHYLLTLQSVGTINYVEGGFDPGITIPTYNWTYTQIGVNPTPLPAPVCSGALIDHYYKDAILFSGDRYDGASAKVIATGDTQPWFNFACKDDVLWKQFLFRYVAVAGAGGFATSVAARNTSIAAIHADYCGVNHPYTVTGTDVDWANREGWLSIGGGYTQVEAIWGGAGRAICLRNPRHVARSEVDCAGHGPPPLCTSDQVDHWAELGYEMITYVP